MTLIEAPLNDARTLAVIAKAREIKPDKPLTHVVNSHHHFDHSGGIRAAVSEGLTVVAQKASAQFFQDAVARAHTIVPDALAKNPKPLKIETVDEELELKDATRTVNAVPRGGESARRHAADAYFPKERILVLRRRLHARRGAHAVCAEPDGEHHEAQPARRPHRPAPRHDRSLRRSREGRAGVKNDGKLEDRSSSCFRVFVAKPLTTSHNRPGMSAST